MSRTVTTDSWGILHPLSPTTPQSHTGSLEAESLVEGLSRGGILGSKALDEVLGGAARILGSLVGLADVGELIADAVGDDVGVESILLALGDESINGEEGTLIGLATRTAELEAHLGGAETEVESAVVSTSISIVVVIVVVAGVASSSGGTDDLSEGGRGGAVNGGGGSNGTAAVASSGTSTSASIGGGAIGGLTGEVGEAVGEDDVGNAQAVSLEGVGDGGGRVGVLNIRASDIGVDERDDTTESGGGGEVGIVADGGDDVGEGVGVLLRSDEGDGDADDGGVITKLGDDGVGKLELGARVGTGEEDTGALAGEGTGLTGLSESVEPLDEVLDQALLPEAGLGDSHQDGESSSLGIHFDRVFHERKKGVEL